jgi:hypothetical protein
MAVELAVRIHVCKLIQLGIELTSLTMKGPTHHFLLDKYNFMAPLRRRPWSDWLAHHARLQGRYVCVTDSRRKGTDRIL